MNQFWYGVLSCLGVEFALVLVLAALVWAFQDIGSTRS